jgi:hypothetical protein
LPTFWSTPEVHRLTMERAAEVGVPVINAGWYDADDTPSLGRLVAAGAGERLGLGRPGMTGAAAPATRRFLELRHAPLREGVSW